MEIKGKSEIKMEIKGKSEIKMELKKTGGVRNQYMLAILANMPNLIYGMLMGWLSPAITQLTSPDGPADCPYSDADISWMGGIVGLTAVVGVAPLGILADKFGRKRAMLAMAVPQAITWIMKLLSTTPTVTIIARGLSGFSGAGVFIIIPLYVREISDDSCRGTLGAFVALFTNLGVIIAYTLGAYVDYFIVLWIYTALPIIFFVVFLKAPETPSYLVKINRYEEATRTVAWLKGLSPTDALVIQEVGKLKKENEKADLMPKVSFMNIVCNPGTRTALFTSVAIIYVHSLGGSVAVTAYASLILARSDSGMSPDAQALVTSLLQTAGCLIGLSIVDRIGRKILLVITTFTTFISVITLTIYFFLWDSGIEVPGVVALLAAGLCVMSYGAGLCPLAFIIITEMFDFQTRATVVGYLITYAWTNSTIVLFGFNPLASFVGMGGVFAVFAANTLFGTLYFLFRVPETQGKTVEEIQQELLKKRPSNTT